MDKNCLILSNSPLLESSGSGYVILNYSMGLRKKGFSVDLFGPEHYLAFPNTATGLTYRKAAGMLGCALKQMLKKKYDLVELWGAETWLVALALSRIPSRHFLLVHHSNGIEPHASELMLRRLGSYNLDGTPPKWYQGVQGPLQAQAFSAVDALVTVSKFDGDYAQRHKYKPESRILAIDNSLPDTWLNLMPKMERPPLIAFCGSWLARKGSTLIPEAITRILREHNQCGFILFGVGDDFQPSEHFAADVIDRVKVTPPFITEREVLKQLFQGMAIFIMPSIYESFGMVAAESMACGCALVATKVGFAYSLQGDEEAIIIEPSVESLYQGLNKLLVDENLRLRIANAGYKRVQSLRWSEAVDRLAAHYDRWMAERKGSR